jgi:uncharacterized phage protein gp47/JayE
MADSIGVDGLEVATLAELIADLLNGYDDPFTGAYIPGFNSIYSTDINTDSNTPDGQLINLFAQMAIDIRELLVQINNSFDPDQAQGALLDQRVAINNITRIGGTYTVQPIVIVVSATVTLQGLDANYDSPTATAYTVQDGLGNQFYLAATTTLTVGSHTCDFRAAAVGAVSVPINTITVPVTIVAGVTSVNNPVSAITVGVNEEIDAALRIRRAASTAMGTSGNAQGLLGDLLALPGVTEAAVYQNRTGSVVNTMLPHSVWAIVAGGAAAGIAQLLYETISDGCNMNGAQSYTITTPSGALFTANWDVPTAESLYIKFTIQQTVPNFDFATTAIAAYIAANLVYGIGQFAETSSITAICAAAIAAQGGGGVPVLVQISTDNATWEDYLTTTGLNYEFTVAAANITISVVNL